MRDYTTFGVTIPNGGSLSPSIDLRGYTPYGIQMPAAWTAAGLSFEVSDDNVSFADLYDATAEYTLAAGVDRAIGFSGSSVFAGWKYIKVRSGTTAVPVNQGAARIIKILGRYE